jgi:hypothetical protein
MSVVFFDGAETGDLSAWNASGTIAASTAKPRSGSYSIACTAIGAYVYPATSIPGPFTTAYLRDYVYLHSLSASIAQGQMSLMAHWAGGGPTFYVGVSTDANSNPSLYLHNSVTSTFSPTSYATSAETWHLLEFKVVISATVGILELKVDGVVQISWTGLNTGSTGVGEIYVMMYNYAGTGSPSGTVYHDDILYRTDAYPGPGACRIANILSTTPNHNAWTKSNSSTINTVWDNTPYSSSVNANTATANNEQTGVMDVTPFLNSQDTVNAVKIAWVGLTSSTSSDGADSSIFRTPSGGGGTDTTTAGVAYTTSAGYQETILATTPTSSQIRSCEAGVEKGSGTNTHTVYMLWLMVDYTALDILRAAFRRYRPIPPIPRVIRKRTEHRQVYILAHPVHKIARYHFIPPVPRVIRKRTEHRQMVTPAQLATSLMHVARAQAHAQKQRALVPVRRRPVRRIRLMLAMLRHRAMRARAAIAPKAAKRRRSSRVAVLLARVAHGISRRRAALSAVRQRLRGAHHVFYPIGMPFVHVARLGRKALRFPRQPYIRPRAERWVRYPIGMPFVRIARLGKRALRFPVPRAGKPREYWHVHYPLARIARLGKRALQFPRLRPIKPRPDWHVHYPIGMPFVHVARLGKKAPRFPRQPYIRPRAERWSRYPTGISFVRAVRTSRRLLARQARQIAGRRTGRALKAFLAHLAHEISRRRIAVPKARQRPRQHDPVLQSLIAHVVHEVSRRRPAIPIVRPGLRERSSKLIIGA